MYDQVVLIISEHDTIWQSNVPFTETYSTFSQRLIGLKEYIENQTALMGVHTIRKEEFKNALISEVIRIEQVLQFFASRSENADLFNSVDHTKSFWARIREVDRLMASKHIADLLEEHLNELEDYGLLQADLDMLNTKIADYEQAMSEPRNMIIHRAIITKGH